MRKLLILLTIIIFSWNIGFAQNRGTIQINTNDVVHYIVTDPQGRRTGTEPGGTADPDSTIDYDEIPHANYAVMPVGDIPDPGQEPEAQYSHEFLHVAHSSDSYGEYKIEFFGLHEGVYELSMNISVPNHKSFNFRDSGEIRENELVTYLFNFTDDPSVALSMQKTGHSRLLHRQIRLKSVNR